VNSDKPVWTVKPANIDLAHLLDFFGITNSEFFSKKPPPHFPNKTGLYARAEI
jgi:hypothetical protein